MKNTFNEGCGCGGGLGVCGRYFMTIMQIYKGGCKFQIRFIDFHQKGKCCIQADAGDVIQLLVKTQTIYWPGI